MKIILSAEADSDLLHILRYLAARDRAAAVTSLFNSKFENLVRFPFIKRERSIFARGLGASWPKII